MSCEEGVITSPREQLVPEEANASRLNGVKYGVKQTNYHINWVSKNSSPLRYMTSYKKRFFKFWLAKQYLAKAPLANLAEDCSGIQMNVSKPKEFLAEFTVGWVFSVSGSRNTGSAVPAGPKGLLLIMEKTKLGHRSLLSLVCAGENEIDPLRESHGISFGRCWHTVYVSYNQPLRLRVLMEGLATVMRAPRPRGQPF